MTADENTSLTDGYSQIINERSKKFYSEMLIKEFKNEIIQEVLNALEIKFKDEIPSIKEIIEKGLK